MAESILVTGGAGYVGSHVVVELAKAGYTPVILDSFATSARAVLPRLATLAGADLACIEADVRDTDALRGAFHEHPIAGVIHCAGLDSVEEAETRPLTYYGVNVGGSFALAEVMGEAGVATLVYSSSATVYGEPESLPVTEDAPLAPLGVYGRTKCVVENFLRDLARANPNWRIAVLRYFTAAGAHPSGLIGEAPEGRPSNLVPLLCRIAAGEYSDLAIYGTDWPTPDGTGLRDYLHVQDLAAGYVATLRYLSDNAGAVALNLGQGRGRSVLDVVTAFERACGRRIARSLAPRRPGDIAACYADCARAAELVGWRATRGLDAICADAWRWQQNGGRY